MKRCSLFCALVALAACGDDSAPVDAGPANAHVDAPIDAEVMDAATDDAATEDDGGVSSDAGLEYRELTPGIGVAVLGDTTDEAGTTSFSLWIRLLSDPGALVDIGLSSSDEGEVVAEPARIRVSSRDWEAPIEVTVRGVDDALADGDVEATLILSASSAASGFDSDGLNVASVTNLDDELLLEGASAISVGDQHVCALVAGAVQCWGAGDRGQLGNADIAVSYPTPVAGIDDAFALGVGPDFSCVVRGSDPALGGTAWCWGAGTQGQLGDGMSRDATSPTQVMGITDAIALAAGSDFACAVHASGEVSCWGRGTDGRLGAGNENPHPTPVLVGNIDDAIDVAASDQGACALRATGGVRCWGRNSFGQARGQSGADVYEATNVVGLARIESISAAGDSYCALREDNAIRCWGENGQNQLGDRSGEHSSVRGEPTTPLSDHGDVVALGGGGDHHCIFSNTGQLVCWGTSPDAAVGNGAPVSYPVVGFVRNDARPYDHLDEDVASLAGRGSLTCALTTAGRVACMGPPTSAPLGADGWSDEGFRTEAPPGLLRRDFDLLESTPLTTCAVETNEQTFCWGGDPARYDGAQGNGHTLPVTVPSSFAIIVEELYGFRMAVIDGGPDGFIAILRDRDRGMVWGRMGYPLAARTPYYGGLGEDFPGRFSGADRTSRLALGEDHVCWLEPDMMGAWCYGRDTYGQLGNDAALGSSLPSRDGVAVANITLAREVVSGANHACAIQDADDGLFCWGRNLEGQLGTGDTSSSGVPLAPSALPSSAEVVAAGGNATCAVADGVMTCVGDLGAGTGTVGRSFGVSDIDAVELGDDIDAPSGCALADRSLHCWGISGGTYDAPATIGEGVELFAVGRAHVCWADATRIRCTGSPEHGVLGGYDLMGLRYIGAAE